MNRFILFFITLLLLNFNIFVQKVQASYNFNYEGILTDTNGLPISSQNEYIKLQIKAPTVSGVSGCLLYEEIIGMTTGVDGYFSVHVGTGTRTDVNSWTLSEVFNNAKNYLVTGTSCYISSPGDERVMTVAVSSDNQATWDILAGEIKINASPFAEYATNALSLGGLPSLFYLTQGTGASSLSQSNLANIFTTTNYNNLLSLLSTPPTNYVTNSNNGAVALPQISGVPTSPTTGQIWYDSAAGFIKYYNGSTSQNLASGGGSAPTGAAGGDLSGNYPNPTLATVGTASTYLRVNIDAKGRVISGSNTLVDADIPQLTSANKVLPSAIAAGTLSNTISINTNGGNIYTGSGSISTGGGAISGTGVMSSTNFSTSSGGAANNTSYNFGSSGTGFYSPVTNQIGFATSGIERMRINSIGQVGIGTNSPDALLVVAGTMKVTTICDQTGTLCKNTDTGFSNAGGFISSITTGTNSGIFAVTTGSSSNLTLDPALTGFLNLSTNGYISRIAAGSYITTFAFPTAGTNTLVQRDSSGTSSFYGVNIAGISSGNLTLLTPSVLSNYSLTFPNTQGAANQTLVTNDAAGSFVWRTVPTTGGVFTAGSGSASGPSVNFNSDTSTGIFSPSAGVFAISTAAIQQFTINSTGRVGIGTAAPSFKLDINGTSTNEDRTIAINGLPVAFLPDQAQYAGSIAIGDGLRSSTSGGSYNTSVGLGSMYSTTSGGYNTGIGNSSLNSNTTGSQNTGVGAYSLKNNTTGTSNTAMGANSLYGIANMSGSQNSAFGTSSLGSGSFNATGNSAFGHQSLMGVTTGNYNTAVGLKSGSTISTGANNTLLGFYTGYTGNGSNNTFIGYQSGISATGSNNLFIGANAGSNATLSGSNNVILGGNTGATISTTSNNIIISDGTGTIRQFIDPAGNVGIGTISPKEPFHIYGQESTANIPHLLIENGGSTTAGPMSQSALIIKNFSGVNNTFPVIKLDNSRGTNNSPTTLVANDLLGSIQISSGTQSAGGSAKINFMADQAFTNTANGTSIAFHTASNNTVAAIERLRIANNGFVGIGTPSPTALLQLKAVTAGTLLSLKNPGGTDVFSVDSSGMTSLSGNIYTPANLQAAQMQLSDGTSTAPAVTRQSDTLTGMYFVNSPSISIGFSISAATKLTIGTSSISPGTDLTMTLGDSLHRFTSIYASNATINTSDEREKKNIETSDLGLQFITNLRPVSYYWKSGIDDDRHYGLIAQETEKIISQYHPKNLTTDSEPIVFHDKQSDRYGLRYTELISPIIKAIQELFTQTTDQSKDIARIINANKNLETELRELKKQAEQLSIENKDFKIKIEKANLEANLIKSYLCKKEKNSFLCKE